MCSLFYVLLPAITITIQIYFPHSPYIEWSKHRHGKCQNMDTNQLLHYEILPESAKIMTNINL